MGKTLALWAMVGAVALAQPVDPRLTVADVEKVSGLTGIQLVAMGSVPGAGAGLNFAGADKRMIVMLNFGNAAMYQHAKDQKGIEVNGTTIPMPTFHAEVRGLGDEAFDGPPGPMQYVLYVRKGNNALSLTAYMSRTTPMKPTLTMEQLKQLAAVVVSRL